MYLGYDEKTILSFLCGTLGGLTMLLFAELHVKSFAYRMVSITSPFIVLLSGASAFSCLVGLVIFPLIYTHLAGVDIMSTINYKICYYVTNFFLFSTVPLFIIPYLIRYNRWKKMMSRREAAEASEASKTTEKKQEAFK